MYIFQYFQCSYHITILFLNINTFLLFFKGGQHPDDITCLTSDTFLVFTACKNVIYAWRRGTEVNMFVYVYYNIDYKF